MTFYEAVSPDPLRSQQQSEEEAARRQSEAVKVVARIRGRYTDTEATEYLAFLGLN
jgi:hypothetical protein